MKVEFTVNGEPQGKGRPEFSTNNGFVNVRTPDKTVIYENLVKIDYKTQCKNFKFHDDAELRIVIDAFYKIPKNTSKNKRLKMLSHEIRPIKKTDLDNVAKIICDSLNGIAYRDDSQIVQLNIGKYYSENPAVNVAISEI